MPSSPESSPRSGGFRRPRFLLAALAVLGATVVVAPQPAAAARPKVLLIGDSTLAALDWYASSQRQLRGLDYVLEAESCRAVTATSCVGRTSSNGTRIRPSNALSVLRSYPAGTFEELVLMVGYDESASAFRESVVELPRVARDLGVDHITWLTFRTDVDYDAPVDDSSYRGNNRLLYAAAESSGGYIDLLDWDYWVDNHSGLVEADGVHLTAKGASEVATLIRQAVINHWGSDAVSSSSSAASNTASNANSAASPTSATGADERPTLSYGVLGEPVRTAQELLLDVGSEALAPYGVTGRYYAATRRAVREFQQMVQDEHDASMVVDGVIGLQTWAWLEELADGSRPSSGASTTSSSAGRTTSAGSSTSTDGRMTLSYGVLGPPVEELQEILLRIGSPTLEPFGVTGRYYAVTRTAVREFQERVQDRYDSSMVVDGIVGPATWRWLDELDPG